MRSYRNTVYGRTAKQSVSYLTMFSVYIFCGSAITLLHTYLTWWLTESPAATEQVQTDSEFRRQMLFSNKDRGFASRPAWWAVSPEAEIYYCRHVVNLWPFGTIHLFCGGNTCKPEPVYFVWWKRGFSRLMNERTNHITYTASEPSAEVHTPQTPSQNSFSGADRRDPARTQWRDSVGKGETNGPTSQ